MKPESGRVYASLSPSLSRASSIDRSIASRCLRSRRARRSLPSSLVRDNPIPSRAIHSSRGRAAPSSPASIASTAPRARRSTYIHKHQLIDQTKKTITTRTTKNKNKEPDRWHHPRARLRVPSPRARRLDPSIDRARIVLARAGDVDSSSRLARESRVRRVRSVGRSVVAFDGRGRRRRRADASRANGTARANGARDANARETEVEVRRDRGAGRGGGMRSRNAIETRSSIVRGRFAEGVDSME